MRPLLPALLVAAAPLAGQADTAAMARAQRLLDVACAADRSATWGRPVCGPVLLATWGSRTVVASERDAAGTFTPVGRWFVGTLGDGQFPSNTAIDVGGTRWSMVVLPLPADDALATTLLAHEQFHRIQRDLALPMTSPENAHLDEQEGRTLLRLEWRALARAIASTGSASCRASRDALAFRAARHAAAPGSAESEALLERHEGLAEYTGQRLARGSHPGGDRRMIDYLAEAEGWRSYVRSFAYATGAAYGTLLDRADPRWRQALDQGRSPAAMLAERLRCRDAGDAVELRAARYDGDALRQAEQQRADSVRRIRDDYTGRLVQGPTLVTPDGNLRFTFDPNTVVPLGAHGNVHPTGSFSGAWGTLEVTAGGALLSPDFQRVRVALMSDGVSKWKLTLAEGWRVVDDAVGQRIIRVGG